MTPIEALYVYQYYFNEVSPAFKIREKTLHIAFSLFTYAYHNFGIQKEQMKILALTCLLSACKADELDENIPFFEDLQISISKSPNLAMITIKDELNKKIF